MKMVMYYASSVAVYYNLEKGDQSCPMHHTARNKAPTV